MADTGRRNAVGVDDVFLDEPRVDPPASDQPWAEGRNAVGVAWVGGGDLIWFGVSGVGVVDSGLVFLG